MSTPPSHDHTPHTTGPAADQPTGHDGDQPAPTLRVSLASPEQLVVALPHLLGFAPAESVVLVGLRTENGRTRVEQMVRGDLPTVVEDIPMLIGALLGRFERETPDAVVIIVVSEATASEPAACDEPSRAWAGLVEALEMGCMTLGLEVQTQLWTPRIAPGAPWGCYPPCECRGVLPDPHHTPLAAAASVLGQVTYGSRDALTASLAAEPRAESAPLRQLIDAERFAAELDRRLDPGAAARRDLDALARAAGVVAGGGVLDDQHVAQVTAALADRLVRDHCLGWALGDGPVTAEVAEQLWTFLTRATPAPEVAEPATLLAFAALIRGGGGLVGVALERARVADPAHTLSQLLGGIVASGFSPDDVRELVRSSSREASQLIEEAHPTRA